MTFGEKLSSLRKQANLTQNALADMLCVSRQAVTKWENGSGFPDIDNLKKLASIFNTTIDELLDYEIEEIELEFDTIKEKIDKKCSKLKNVDNFILERFKNADSIERLIRQKKLSFWQWILDFFIGAGSLEVADLLLSGMVYAFLVKEKNHCFLALVNKTTLITKRLEQDFEKSTVIDGYKYSKYRKNGLKQLIQ